jgi:hypothetical protein
MTGAVVHATALADYVRDHMVERGITNPTRLAAKAGLAHETVRRIFAGVGWFRHSWTRPIGGPTSDRTPACPVRHTPHPALLGACATRMAQLEVLFPPLVATWLVLSVVCWRGA